MDNVETYQLLNDFENIKAFTTSRSTFYGENLPRFTGSPVKRTLENKVKLAQILGIGVEQLVFPRQTHSSNVVGLSELPLDEFKETDALVTNTPGICLCVQTADCVPILLYDPVSHAVSAVHAGWRGTVGQIVRAAVLKLAELYSSSSSNIRAVIGPSIGPEKYEVGNEVADAVLKSVPNARFMLEKHISGKFHLNLWEANRQILLDCGVKQENIEVAGRCTFSEAENFFSARREGIETGRLVSGIMIKK